MDRQEFDAHRKIVTTDFGDIAYVDVGKGPAALFVHGVYLNGYLWRNVIEGLRDERRCIAIDLLGHGHTRVAEGLELSLKLQADMLDAFCYALGLERIDLVGNDSGGAIAQIFAVRHGERLRTLTLTNCDVHDNVPPDAFKPAVDLAKEGQLAPVVAEVFGNLELARTGSGLGASYENPEYITEELVQTYLHPFTPAESGRLVERLVGNISAQELLDIEPGLKELQIPTLIVWGTGDVFFELSWAYWLRDTIPGATKVVEIEGGKLFFPDERADELVPHLRRHWSTSSSQSVSPPSSARGSRVSL